MSTEARISAPSRVGLKEQLRNWLENDETVKQYLRIADIEAIIKLVPERLRVSDYEEQILNLIEEIALGGAA
jgi:chorismate-pyruvate lyase